MLNIYLKQAELFHQNPITLHQLQQWARKMELFVCVLIIEPLAQRHIQINTHYLIFRILWTVKVKKNVFQSTDSAQSLSPTLNWQKIKVSH